MYLFYSSKLSEPMEVYHGQTPVRSMNQSVALFKSHQRAVYDELCKTRPKTFTNFGENHHKTLNQGVRIYLNNCEIVKLRCDPFPERQQQPEVG